MRILLLLLLVLLASPRPAQACECARPAVEVTPRGGGVPTNTRVRLAWPAELKLAPGRIVLRPVQAKKDMKKKDKKDKADKVEVVAVETTVVSYSSGDLRVVELSPKQPLAADTRYEVLAAADEQGKEGVVGTFTTAAAADTTAPTWKGISKAVYVHAKAVCCDCSTGSPYAVLTIAEAADDTTAVDELRYAVWTADAATGKVDTTQPPAILVRGYGGSLSLGWPSGCTAANYVFPDKPVKLLLAVAAVDAAGNMTAPSEIVVDMTKPQKKR